MFIKEEIMFIKDFLHYNNQTLSNALGISVKSLERYIDYDFKEDDPFLETFYSFAYNNKIYLNQLLENMFIFLYNEDCITLFHTSKSKLEFPINLDYCNNYTDMGKGFYLSDDLYQSGCFLKDNSGPYIYSFKFNMNNLKVKSFNVSIEWALLVGYNRRLINCNELINKLLKELDDVDIIIAPICDNHMYSLFTEFIDGDITDLQLVNSLNKTHLRKQFVLKSNKAIEQLTFIKQHYICTEERNYYKLQNILIMDKDLKVAKNSKNLYAGKGNKYEALFNK